MNRYLVQQYGSRSFRGPTMLDCTYVSTYMRIHMYYVTESLGDLLSSSHMPFWNDASGL